MTKKVHECRGEVHWKDVSDVRCSLQAVLHTTEEEQLAAALTWKIPEYQESLHNEAHKLAAMQQAMIAAAIWSWENCEMMEQLGAVMANSSKVASEDLRAVNMNGTEASDALGNSPDAWGLSEARDFAPGGRSGKDGALGVADAGQDNLGLGCSEDVVRARSTEETLRCVGDVPPEPNLPLNPQDPGNDASDVMMMMMMKERTEREAMTVAAEAQAIFDAKEKTRAEAAQKKSKDVLRQESVLPSEKQADGSSSGEADSAGEPSGEATFRKLKIFSFGSRTPIGKRSSAFQSWKRSQSRSTTCGSASSFDLSTSAGFSTSASSEDGESSAKEAKRSSDKSSETEDLEADLGCSKEFPPLSAASPARVTRRTFGTPMPSPVQSLST
jgi:hypothetical protein